MALSGADVALAFGGLLTGMAGSWNAVKRAGGFDAVPAHRLSVTVAFRGGLFNIGAEASSPSAPFAAALAGVGMAGLPPGIHAVAAVCCGAAGGVAWGLVPGWLKARFGAHEVITTIMMNYVAVSLVDYTW